ncbi:hypothetical protein [Actinoplanes sp. M2I2]|uniref:hypothetical protein n=1 Tax=Actinoplanes sp. M2I2 TaxID=1734444 RepID=UPI0020211243|nr:hypothetical protein [Actinoplanes sp. M2I2]
MDDLPALLRAASDGAPPTGIDLDDLIVGHRRRRRARWTAASAGAAVLIIAGLSLTLTNRTAGSTWPAEPAPVATGSAGASCTYSSLPSFPADRNSPPINGPLPEEPQVAAQRLATALAALLPEQARPGGRPGCAGTVIFQEPKAGDFRAVAWAGAGRDEYSLAFKISTVGTDTVPRCLNGDHASCTRSERPGGAVVMADLIGADTPSPQRSVTVYRPDGTSVLVVAIGRLAALPSADRLATIGSAPQLTLYP